MPSPDVLPRALGMSEEEKKQAVWREWNSLENELEDLAQVC